MRILLFGGTSEGRELCAWLTGKGHEVTVCVATSVGEEMLKNTEHIEVLTGRKDEEQIKALVQGYDLCIDATHPYAREISANIRNACEAEHIPLRRILRDESRIPDSCLFFPDLQEAAKYLSGQEGNILLTTGTKELGCFDGIGRERLFVRILPCHESLNACEKAGILHKNIIAMFGPFSEEMNTAVLRQYLIAFLVTKDSGREGGLEEKLRAAGTAGATVCLIGRPAESGLSVRDLMKWMQHDST